MAIIKATILVIHTSIYFLILFTAYNAYQNIVTKIHQDEGDSSLGPFQLSLNYIFMIGGNIVAPIFSKKFSAKYLITFCSLGYAFHYMLGFFMKGSSQIVKYLVAGFGASVNGIGAAFIWVGVGSYIHNICHKYDLIEKKGYYYGLFSAIYTWSTVLGAIIMTFGLQILSEYLYFLLTSVIAILSFFYALIFLENVNQTQNEKQRAHSIILQKPETESLITSKQVQQGCKNSDFNLKQQMINLCLSYKKMYMALPMIWIDGINVAVTSSYMLHLLPKVNDKYQDNLNVGLCEICFGFGCIIGGFLGGKLCDLLHVKLCCIWVNIVYSMTCILSIIAAIFPSFAIAAICCFLWGFNVYAFQAVELVICSRIFGGKPQTFAVVKQFHCVSMVLFFIFGVITKNNVPVKYLMIVLLFLVIPSILGVMKLPVEQKISNRQEIIDCQQKDTNISDI